MIRTPFVFRETIATILADKPEHIEAAKSGMLAARQVLEAHIACDPFFLATFDPYIPVSDEVVILRMAHAARKAGVGPMAAVAGAIAWSGIEAMADAGAEFGVIDNGGDIALISDRSVRVGVHAGKADLSNRIAFVVPASGKNTWYLHIICNCRAFHIVWCCRCCDHFLARCCPRRCLGNFSVQPYPSR